MDVRRVYAAGLCLGLFGCLLTTGSVIFVGDVSVAVISAGSFVGISLGLRNVYTRESFDREHSLPYRIGNWSMAVLTVGLGVLMLSVGLMAFLTFV